MLASGSFGDEGVERLKIGLGPRRAAVPDECLTIDFNFDDGFPLADKIIADVREALARGAPEEGSGGESEGPVEGQGVFLAERKPKAARKDVAVYFLIVSVAGTARPILLDGVPPPPRPGIFSYAG